MIPTVFLQCLISFLWEQIVINCWSCLSCFNHSCYDEMRDRKGFVVLPDFFGVHKIDPFFIDVFRGAYY